MASSKRLDGAGDLAKEVGHWIHMEGENRELKERVASALDEIKGFIEERRSDLERRKNKLLQTSGYKDETRAMEAALANIQQLIAAGRNISRIFAEIDKYLGAYKIDDTLSRLHTRIQLADARDEFMCAFHDSVRGTRLSELLDILYFMPFAYWRARGLERRNYRSPSAAEILNLLEELGRRGVDINRIDIVQLAAIIRLQLGITPRMDYHTMSANKLAELLTDAETLTRHTAKAMPLDAGFCRTADGILTNLRRWEAEFFGGAGWAVPGEIETEMLQIVFLAGESIRISGSESERSTDYLWLLATVIASGRATLKEVLATPSVKNTRFSSVYARILGTRTYLDRIAVLADKVLVARWSEARVALNSLTGRSEVIAAKATHDYGEFTELERLRERRSEVGKSLIKSSDSLLLIEPALLDLLAAPEGLSGLPLVNEHLRTLDPAKLMDRNRTIAEETKLIARQELDKLRVLIGRIATISRLGFAASPAQEALERQRATEIPALKTADGIEIGTLAAAGLQAILLGALRKTAVSLREFKGKVEGARKRSLKSDLLHTSNMLYDKIKKAADLCDKIDAETVDTALAPAAAETIAPLLREILAAQTNFSARLNNAKLTPADKQPLTNMLYTMKTKLSDDLRDIENIRSELVRRSAETAAGTHGDADRVADEFAAADVGAERGADAPRGEAPAAAAGARETAAKAAGVTKMAGLASAANAALKPVKDKMTRLSTLLSGRRRENPAILAAARDLKSVIAEARQLMIGNFALIESIAATVGTTGEGHADKFARWQRQLAAVEEETGRLLEATECIAGIAAAVRTAAALEEEISGQPPAGGKKGTDAEDLLSRCRRCALALDTIERSSGQLREARETCAAAARAEWRLLKGAAGYLESSGADLDACESALKRSRSWIEELQTILNS